MEYWVIHHRQEGHPLHLGVGVVAHRSVSEEFPPANTHIA